MSKKPEKPDLHKYAFGTFMDEFISESDRAAVILGAAKIDSLLGHILDKYLLPCPSATDDLLEGDSPLATFSARIKICHRLGIIDDQLAKLLNTFRKLRNGFAHDVTHSSLASGSARDRVMSLSEPFTNSLFFQALLRKVAKEMKRETVDPGVVFRAVLAAFYIDLGHIHQDLTPTSRQFDDGIIDSIMKAAPPGSKESLSTESPKQPVG